MNDPEAEKFVACPLCKQYSHSIPDDKIAEAFRHFESMYEHPLRGTPMGHNFDEQTRDYAQVLVALASRDPEAAKPTERECSCMEIAGEDARCILHGAGTRWAKENPDFGAISDQIADLKAEAAKLEMLVEALEAIAEFAPVEGLEPAPHTQIATFAKQVARQALADLKADAALGAANTPEQQGDGG